MTAPDVARLVETAAEAIATSVNPNCPWFDKAPEDRRVYREDARRVLAAVLPKLADEIERAEVVPYREAAAAARIEFDVEYHLPERLKGVADAADLLRSLAEGLGQ